MKKTALALAVSLAADAHAHYANDIYNPIDVETESITHDSVLVLWDENDATNTHTQATAWKVVVQSDLDGEDDATDGKYEHTVVSDSQSRGSPCLNNATRQ